MLYGRGVSAHLGYERLESVSFANLWDVSILVFVPHYFDYAHFVLLRIWHRGRWRGVVSFWLVDILENSPVAVHYCTGVEFRRFKW